MSHLINPLGYNKKCLINAKIIALSINLFFYIIGYAQNGAAGQEQAKHDSVQIKYDSAKNRLYEYLVESGDSELMRRRLQYFEDSVSANQDKTIDLIKNLTLEIQTYLENGIDTSGLANELEKINYWYEISSDGVFINVGSIQTQRNLETTYKIMRELLFMVSTRKSSLDHYYDKLIEYRTLIDSFYKEEVLYRFSSDSSVLRRYVDKLAMVSQDVRPIDSALKKTILSVAELQPPINLLANRLSSSIEQIGVYQRDISSKTFRPEATKLWSAARYTRPFDVILSFSLIKAKLAFVFYTTNELGKIIVLLLLVAISAGFLFKLKRKIEQQQQVITNDRDQLLLHHPFLTAFFVVLNIFQFVFVDPPFVFSLMLWILSGIALTFILKRVVVRYWMLSWLVVFLLFLLACADNLILQASRPERWLMLALSLIGVLTSVTILLKGLSFEVKEKLLYYFILFNAIMQAASVLANCYGFYNLAKAFLTAGFTGLALAILFFWTLHFIHQFLVLCAKAYDKPDRKLFSVNFDRGARGVPVIFYLLLLTGWFVLFGRNFYVFRMIANPIKDFITEKRSVGDFSFSIGTMFEFFLILYVSGMISRLVSVFSSAGAEWDENRRKGGMGRWSLIIRICIISIGLLAAFAAVGIPMDRLTIILSALSVGVGFGLQTLVNNLVSGLIILFERPLRVGDIVEIAGQTGVVKSIGFRSSIITTAAGANVVIPNGDLLNRHLVNWTHENATRAVDITVCVIHGTNLEHAIRILKEMPGKDKRILTDPSPSVLVKKFSDHSTEIHLSFWVKNLTESSEIQSNIMLAIDLAFRENGIVMTFPRQEFTEDR